MGAEHGTSHAALPPEVSAFPPGFFARTRPPFVVGASVTLAWCMALAISFGSAGGLAGWWAGLGGALALGSIAVEPARGRARLALTWLGAVPMIAIQALWETTPAPSPSPEAACGNGFFAVLAWPFVVGGAAAAIGTALVAARHRVLQRRGRRLVTGLALAVALAVPLAELARPGEASTVRVLAELDAGDDEVGDHEAAGLLLFHQRVEHGITHWDLRPALGPVGGFALGESIEIVRAGGETYLRPARSTEPRDWARVEDGELVRPLLSEALRLPPSAARRAATLAWTAGLVGALVLLLRRAWLARRRERIATGTDALVGSNGDAWLAGTCVHLGRARPGPVVLFVGKVDPGSYRAPPRGEAPAFVAGTRAGRRLRWLASMERSVLYAGLLLALTAIPALLHALH